MPEQDDGETIVADGGPVQDGEQPLPDTLEEFVEAADRKDKLVCDTCGEPVERQYIQDGECVGCRKGPGIHATREVTDD